MLHEEDTKNNSIEKIVLASLRRDTLTQSLQPTRSLSHLFLLSDEHSDTQYRTSNI